MNKTGNTNERKLTTDISYVRTRKKKEKRTRDGERHVLANIAGISIERVVDTSPFLPM